VLIDPAKGVRKTSLGNQIGDGRWLAYLASWRQFFAVFVKVIIVQVSRQIRVRIRGAKHTRHADLE
jgi:hypothetical protein